MTKKKKFPLMSWLSLMFGFLVLGLMYVGMIIGELYNAPNTTTVFTLIGIIFIIVGVFGLSKTYKWI